MKQKVAFINRENELRDLITFIDKEPSEILFIHGTKSSGKTALLYKFLDQTGKEQKLDVKFLNLRKIYKKNVNYKDFIKVFFNIEDKPEDAEKIWDTVTGSMWEIQDILSDLFDKPINDVLAFFKKKMRGIIAHYIGADDKKEKTLRLFLKKDQATLRDFVNEGIGKDEVDELLKDMVRNNILYFDPIEAIYYPQGKKYQWGIRLYIESLNS